MEIRHLKTFKAVATLLSFNKAAKELHYAQSSVSAQIKALEGELEVRLFDRLGRGIALTAAGEQLLPYAQKMVDLSEETLADISGSTTPRGHLTIRVPESMAVSRLPKVIGRFHSQFPKVRLTFTTCAHEGLQEDLRKGVTDLAFLLTEGIRAGDLATKIIGYEKILMVAAPHHPLAGRSGVTAEDVAGQCLLFSKADCSYRRIFEETLKRQGLPITETVTFQSVAALKACLLAGLGITILPESSVSQEIAQGKLAKLPSEEGTLDVALIMIWYRSKWLSPALQAFMKMVADESEKEM